jgi:lipopolysaccharide export system permease protein
MRILTTYIAREFLKLMGWLLLVFICIYLIVDFSRIDGFVKHGAQIGDIVGYYGYKIPLIIFQTIPVAVLLATVFTLGTLTENSEITAIKASGINIYQIVTPIILTSLLLSLLTMVFDEFIIPHTNKQVEYIERVKIKKKKPRGVFEPGDIWLRGEDGVFYNFQLITPEANLIKDVIIYKYDDNFQLQYRLDTKRMEWKDGAWYVKQAIMRSFDSQGMKIEKLKEKPLPQLKETPASFKEISKKPKAMTYQELRAYVNRLMRQGYDVNRYMVDLYGKLSFPFISLVMAIIGVPFSLRLNRSGGKAIGFGLSLILGFVYWVILSMGINLGYVGTLPPFIAAFGGNILFGLVGIYLLTRVSQ